jgi:DNA-binding transcriptional ArsR family regulator
LEDVFCSRTRMRILKLLFHCGQLNTSSIAQRLGTNYATALRHLALLEKEGVVSQRASGKIRFFRFANTLKARVVMKLLGEWVPIKGKMNDMTGLLARPCDACRKPIGGGYKHCPKCNIYFCFICGYVLQNLSKEFSAKCPMCGEEFI